MNGTPEKLCVPDKCRGCGPLKAMVEAGNQALSSVDANANWRAPQDGEVAAMVLADQAIVFAEEYCTGSRGVRRYLGGAACQAPPGMPSAQAAVYQGRSYLAGN